MEFTLTARSHALKEQLQQFLADEVLPAEDLFWQQVGSGEPHAQPPVLEELKASARRRGLWNLFLSRPTDWHECLTNVEYAPLAELTGVSIPLAPEALNCAAPDTGNMELLAMFGTQEQKQMWLKPLMDGEIRSAYAMTEPSVASSDASNIRTSIVRDGDGYVITGRKWWISGAGRERCRLLIVLGVTDPDGPRHQRHTMLLVPADAPGVIRKRELQVFGRSPWESHMELEFAQVRVPASNLLGEVGAGFQMAQARLGPGRIHHCMRQIGAGERALALLVARAEDREAFGSSLIEQGVLRDWVAHARIELDQARLYTLHAAWLMDTVGNRAAAGAIAGIKVAVPRVVTRVIDRAIQVFGAAGLSEDTPLARMFADARVTRIADGPDEVHIRTVARSEVAAQRLAREHEPWRGGRLR